MFYEATRAAGSILAGFAWGKLVNFCTALPEEEVSKDNAAQPSCCGRLCDIPTHDTEYGDDERNCCERVSDLFYSHLRQIGYALTTLGTSSMGISLTPTTTTNQSGQPIPNARAYVYLFGVAAILTGSLTVIIANVAKCVKPALAASAPLFHYHGDEKHTTAHSNQSSQQPERRDVEEKNDI